jgi:hypothetical protein
MNLLLLYNETQTFTNTVFEHVDSLARYSGHRYFYAHHCTPQPLGVDLARFDGVGIHYCVRLPDDQLSQDAAERIAAYQGLKFLFIQDEYENTRRAWYWIKRLGVQLVFTVVPPGSIERVYPPEEFPGVRFVSNLTGYVPDKLPSVDTLVPPSQRQLVVGHRGRPLPVRYGRLGWEKIEIGRMVKAFCDARGIPSDIAWTEDKRIYGPRWYEFMASCRAMLGSESGSNVFDWDGALGARLREYRQQHPAATGEEVYDHLLAHLEQPGLMNQISPRAFESISLRTVLVLFEGSYSGVLEPWKHYLPLRKDGSNLEEVFAALADGQLVDTMAARAFDDIVASGRYSYASWVRMVDGELEAAAARLPVPAAASVAVPAEAEPGVIRTQAMRARPPMIGTITAVLTPDPHWQPVAQALAAHHAEQEAARQAEEAARQAAEEAARRATEEAARVAAEAAAAEAAAREAAAATLRDAIERAQAAESAAREANARALASDVAAREATARAQASDEAAREATARAQASDEAAREATARAQASDVAQREASERSHAAEAAAAAASQQAAAEIAARQALEASIPQRIVEGAFRMAAEGTPAERKALSRVLRRTALRHAAIAGWMALPSPLRPMLRPIARGGVLPAWRMVRRVYRRFVP